MTDQLRQDLEALQARVAMNWSSWAPSKWGTKIGDGACLLANIDILLGLKDEDLLMDRHAQRKEAMYSVLGFSGRRGVARWNDAQNSNEPVLALIKEAIEKLGQHPHEQ